MTENQIKGYNYEIQIRDYIRKLLNKEAYLWSDTPETILIKNGIIGSHNINRLKRKENKENNIRDTGIDIIQIDDNETKLCSLIQCKNGYTKGLTMNDLAGFMCWMTVLDKLNGYVYHTNKLSTMLKELPINKRLSFIKQKYNEIKQINSKTIKIKPYNYQLIAYNNFKEHFKNNNRGIISMPCGTGKTFTSYLISKDYEQIIFISPLRQFTKQNLDKYIEYGYSDEYLLINSDGERDIDIIKDFIKNNKKFLLSSTYCSIDIINEIINLTVNPLIIIDEFHNLSKTNIFDNNDDFYKILNSNNKILFMSATPRVYELENEDFNNENIFGDIIYNMQFTEAISNKYITDYKIWLPSIHENNNKLNNEIVINIDKIDNIIKSKCIYLYTCLLKTGSKKCIIYCENIEDINNMINIINEMNNFYVLDLNINSITSKTSFKKRTELLNEFTNNNKINLLFSVRILDECIDIPACDSIYITYPSKSKIRTIQRLCRCIRNDNNNPFKIGNIFIWCNEYDSIMETLSGIKEYDLFFKDKIKLIETDFYGESKHEEYLKDSETIKEYILNVKEYKQLSWNDKLKLLEDYIKEHNERPSNKSKNSKTKFLGQWYHDQSYNYDNNIKSMLCLENKSKWEEFMKINKKYFLSNVEEWKLTLNKVTAYIDKHNKRPNSEDSDENIRQLGDWLIRQKRIYKNNEHIMLDDSIKKLWEEFTEKYKDIIIDYNDEWITNLELVKEYINKNNNSPLSDTILGSWFFKQKYNYNKGIKNMDKEPRKSLWEEFINNDKYKKALRTKEDIWIDTLSDVYKYLIENKCRPSEESKDIETKKLGCWLSDQKNHYNKNTGYLKNISEYKKFRDLWNEYIKLENQMISTPEEDWVNNYEKLKRYINQHNDIPSDKQTNDDDTSKLCSWVTNQKTRYKSCKGNITTNPKLKKLWEDLVKEYPKLNIKSDEDEWFDRLNRVQQYININNKKPDSKNNDDDIKKLAAWISREQSNYNKNKKMLKRENIRKIWIKFITDNNKYYPEYYEIIKKTPIIQLDEPDDDEIIV